MKQATIYHNTRCSKSRETMEILEGQTNQIETVFYLETPPSVEALDVLLQKLALEPVEVIRTGEAVFKELGLTKDMNKTRAEWLVIMAENPILIERPIVVVGDKAIIGRPPKKVLSLF